MRLITNASDMVRRLIKRASAGRRANRAGLLAVATFLNDRQVDNLSGGGNDPAGSYPVPVRSGHLRRSAEIVVNDNDAYVMNTARYAGQIHEKNGPFLAETSKGQKLGRIFAGAYKHELVD